MRGYSGMDTHVEWPTAELAALLASGAITSGDRVLDLGAGLGTEAIFLARHGCEVVAIDSHAPARRELRRRLDQWPWARARVSIPKGAAADALCFRDPTPGTFSVVIDRLLLHNVEGEGARAARHLVRTMAYALSAGGILVLRYRRERADEPRDMLGDWGRVTATTTLMLPTVKQELDRYFDIGREVQFAGLVTDPLQTPGALTIAALPMSIVIGRRNAVTVANKRAS